MVEPVQTQTVKRLRGNSLEQWRRLMDRAGLEPDTGWDQTVLVWDEDALAAAGSRLGNLLKCIAVDPEHRGEDLTAMLLSCLRAEAFQEGFRQLFLYTKPENERMFRGLFFYPVAKTDRVLLMEDRADGIGSFLRSFPTMPCRGPVGAAVMNCDPFTLGHRYLIEAAARECRWVYVFVLSEDRGRFPAADRLEMVRRGTADLDNVTVLPTGPYLISAATFPTYFLKDRDKSDTVRCGLDIEIFLRYYVPHFGITHRYVGTEPLSPMTHRYNEELAAALPPAGIVLRQVPRLEGMSGPVSASEVRRLLETGADISHLVPYSTYQYLILLLNRNI